MTILDDLTWSPELEAEIASAFAEWQSFDQAHIEATPADPWELAARAFDLDPTRQAAWRDIARPEQLPPEGRWLEWLILAGRGFGKTRTGAETTSEWARTYPGLRVALVARTFADGRDTMVEGESGLLAVLDQTELRGGSIATAWNRSLGELYLANGSRFKIYSSEKPYQLRGPQFHVAWCDETCAWADAAKGAARETTYSMLLFAVRLPGRPGWRDDFEPRIIHTTTPRPVPLLRVQAGLLQREPARAGIMQKKTTAITRGRTSDNLANLSTTFKANVVDPLLGTTLGRQELDAEVIDDIEGAYLSRPVIDRSRMDVGTVPHLHAIVTSVDPATTTGDSSDQTGIVTCGADAQHHGYLLDDATCKEAPDVWGERVWEQVWAHGSQAIVIEDNQGGDMCQHVLTTTWEKAARKRQRLGLPSGVVPIVRVHPTGRGQGKWIRAQALQPWWEQARIHVVDDGERPGVLEEFIDQATSWTGDPDEDSPDHVDAAVHGLTWLLFPRQRKEQPTAGGGRWGTGSGRR